MKTLLEALSGILRPELVQKGAAWLQLAGYVVKGREAIAEKTAAALQTKPKEGKK